MAIQLAQDFKEFLRLLNEKRVKYLLVGGHAVSFHGYVRPTGDMDIWVEGEIENGQRLKEALTDFGFGNTGLSIQDLIDPTKILRLGIPPVRIEIMTQIDGVQFQECFSSCIDCEVDRVKIHFINLAQLKKNKRASGRLKDLADLDYLP